MKRHQRPSEAENPFWITYSDLLSSMVLLLLVMLVIFIQISQEQQKKLAQELRKSQEAQKKLDALQFTGKRETLRNLRQDLNTLTNELKTKKLNIEYDPKLVQFKVDSKLLFDSNSSEVEGKGKVFLRQLIPLLANVVTKPDYRDLIEGVVFEGRADIAGTPSWNENYSKNLELTQERASNVIGYIFGDDFHNNLIPGSKDREIWYRCRESFRYLVFSSGRSNIEAVRSHIKDPRQLEKQWPNKKLWSSQDSSQRQVIIRLELYNILRAIDSEASS